MYALSNGGRGEKVCLSIAISTKNWPVFTRTRAKLTHGAEMATSSWIISRLTTKLGLSLVTYKSVVLGGSPSRDGGMPAHSPHLWCYLRLPSSAIEPGYTALRVLEREESSVG